MKHGNPVDESQSVSALVEVKAAISLPSDEKATGRTERGTSHLRSRMPDAGYKTLIAPLVTSVLLSYCIMPMVSRVMPCGA
jgi:hypothetical protein